MADLSTTNIFGKLNVIHDAVLKANATITGNVTAGGVYSGDGSGLTSVDAATLGGLTSAQYVRSDADTNMTGDLVFDGTGGSGIYFNAKSGGAYGYVTDGGSGQLAFGSDDAVEFYETDAATLCVDWSLNTQTYNFIGTLQEDGNAVWHAGNDGPGSGLDADTLDGIQGSQFVRSDANDTLSGSYTFTGDLNIQRTSGQYLLLDQDATYATSPGITSFSDTGNAKHLILGATTDALNTAPTAGSTGISFRVQGIEYMRLEQDGDLELFGTNLTGGGRNIIRHNDNWLRLNPSMDFTSGIYCNNSILRTDGTLQVDSSGATFNVNSTSFTYLGNDIWHAGNDGAGSGLDADTVDGVQLSSLVRNDVAGQTFADNSVFNGNKVYFGSGEHNLFNNDGHGNAGVQFGMDGDQHTMSGGAVELQADIDNVANSVFKLTAFDGNKSTGNVAGGGYTLFGSSDGTFKWGGAEIWHSGNDGAGSGLDADTLDGKQLSTIEQDAESAALALVIALG